MGWRARCGLDQEGAPRGKIVLFPGPSMRYVLGREEEGVFVDGTLYLSPLSLGSARARWVKQAARLGIRLAELKKDWIKCLKNERVLIVLKEITGKQLREIEREAKEVVDIGSYLQRIRMRKQSWEIAKLRKACEATKQILSSLDPFAFSTEQKLVEFLIKNSDPAFQPIVATGRNTAFPHHLPTKTKIGNVVLVDFGVKVEGYRADLTRMWFKGEKRLKAKYEAAKEIVFQLIDEINSGEIRFAFQLAKRANTLCKQKGLWPQVHAIGHGIGLEVHELPELKETSRESLDSCVFTLEPGWYGKKGVRFEEMILVDKKGRARFLVPEPD